MLRVSQNGFEHFQGFFSGFDRLTVVQRQDGAPRSPPAFNSS
jgi:c-di-GMP-related signal transduction protein